MQKRSFPLLQNNSFFIILTLTVFQKSLLHEDCSVSPQHRLRRIKRNDDYVCTSARKTSLLPPSGSASHFMNNRSLLPIKGTIKPLNCTFWPQLRANSTRPLGTKVHHLLLVIASSLSPLRRHTMDSRVLAGKPLLFLCLSWSSQNTFLLCESAKDNQAE